MTSGFFRNIANCRMEGFIRFGQRDTRVPLAESVGRCFSRLSGYFFTQFDCKVAFNVGGGIRGDVKIISISWS